MTASADALAEATSVLTAVYERDAAAIAAAVEMLLNHRNLTLEDDEVVSNAIQHFRRRPALGFSDCLMLEVARKAGHLPLGTFDRALARLPGVEAP
jgi:predicted nucleic-acid-binding protein